MTQVILHLHFYLNSRKCETDGLVYCCKKCGQLAYMFQQSGSDTFRYHRPLESRGRSKQICQCINNSGCPNNKLWVGCFKGECFLCPPCKAFAEFRRWVLSLRVKAPMQPVSFSENVILDSLSFPVANAASPCPLKAVRSHLHWPNGPSLSPRNIRRCSSTVARAVWKSLMKIIILMKARMRSLWAEAVAPEARRRRQSCIRWTSGSNSRHFIIVNDRAVRGRKPEFPMFNPSCTFLLLVHLV